MKYLACRVRAKVQRASLSELEETRLNDSMRGTKPDMEHNLADVDADDYMTTAKSGQRMVRAIPKGERMVRAIPSVRWDDS